MAKRGSSRGHFSQSSHILTTSTPRVRTFQPSFRVTPTTDWRSILNRPSRVSLQEVEDRRLFHPLGMFAPPKTVGGSPAGIVVRNKPPTPRQRASSFHNKVRSQTKATLTFAEPSRTVMCIRRKERREVLFAKGGAGSRRMRPPKRTPWSDISCR